MTALISRSASLMLRAGFSRESCVVVVVVVVQCRAQCRAQHSAAAVDSHFTNGYTPEGPPLATHTDPIQHPNTHQCIIRLHQRLG